MKKGHGTATVMRHKCRLKIGDPFNFTQPICCILIVFFHTFLPLILVPESSNEVQILKRGGGGAVEVAARCGSMISKKGIRAGST